MFCILHIYDLVAIKKLCFIDAKQLGEYKYMNVMFSHLMVTFNCHNVETPEGRACEDICEGLPSLS